MASPALAKVVVSDTASTLRSPTIRIGLEGSSRAASEAVRNGNQPFKPGADRCLEILVKKKSCSLRQPVS